MNGTLPLSNKKRLPIAVVVSVLGIAAIALLLLLRQGGAQTAGTANDPAPSGGLSAGTRTNEANAVTVSIDWPGAVAGPTFKVALNTHSVDLDAYDLGQLATLRVDQGPEVRPIAWAAPLGGHHREGTLQFPATAADGRPLIGLATRTIDLVIRDVAGVPLRTFRWP